MAKTTAAPAAPASLSPAEAMLLAAMQANRTPKRSQRIVDVVVDIANSVVLGTVEVANRSVSGVGVTWDQLNAQEVVEEARIRSRLMTECAARNGVSTHFLAALLNPPVAP